MRDPRPVLQKGDLDTDVKSAILTQLNFFEKDILNSSVMLEALWQLCVCDTDKESLEDASSEAANQVLADELDIYHGIFPFLENPKAAFMRLGLNNLDLPQVRYAVQKILYEALSKVILEAIERDLFSEKKKKKYKVRISSAEIVLKNRHESLPRYFFVPKNLERVRSLRSCIFRNRFSLALGIIAFSLSVIFSLLLLFLGYYNLKNLFGYCIYKKKYQNVPVRFLPNRFIMPREYFQFLNKEHGCSFNYGAKRNILGVSLSSCFNANPPTFDEYTSSIWTQEEQGEPNILGFVRLSRLENPTTMNKALRFAPFLIVYFVLQSGFLSAGMMHVLKKVKEHILGLKSAWESANYRSLLSKITLLSFYITPPFFLAYMALQTMLDIWQMDGVLDRLVQLYCAPILLHALFLGLKHGMQWSLKECKNSWHSIAECLKQIEDIGKNKHLPITIFAKLPKHFADKEEEVVEGLRKRTPVF